MAKHSLSQVLRAVQALKQPAYYFQKRPKWLCSTATLKKETGKTSTEHLQLYLIDEAKNNLLDPKKTVAEIAYELGFEYPPYFSRLFKKKEGISPTAYREKFKMN